MTRKLASSDQISSGKIWQKLRGKLQPTATPPPPSTSPSYFPTEQQCTTHLKLMKTFSRLRTDLVNAQVQPALIDSIIATKPHSSRSSVEDYIREKVWHAYLRLAAARFELWWKSRSIPKASSTQPNSGGLPPLTIATCLEPGKLEAILEDTKPLVWTEKNLPPIDVLMVLHSFMLNPRCFLEDCLRFGMLPLWKAGMPWHILDRVLDSSTNTYAVPDTAKNAWEKSTGCNWNIRLDTLSWTQQCPLCNSAMRCKATTIALGDEDMKIEDLEHRPTIYCEPCDRHWREEELEVYKLRRAIEDLRQHNVPMPGTILSKDGLAQSSSQPGKDPDLFELNRALQGPLGEQILAMIPISRTASSTDLSLPTISAIRSLMIDSMPTPSPSFRTALHRLTNQHTSNATPFALDLARAVYRQGVFIRAMDDVCWLHSPSLTFTLSSLLSRYEVFFRILATYKSNIAVPTYAVDLAWHTHQLSPASYYTYSVRETGGVLIDHDDRIGEGERTDAFAWTCERYQDMTGMEYGECLCWFCAAAREMLGAEEVRVDEGGHVVLESGSKIERDVREEIARKQYEKLNEDFSLECALAERHCLPKPDQKTFLESYIWLYPRARPVLDGPRN